MATRKYGLSRGEEEYEVTVAVGSAITDEIELTIDEAVILDQEQALLLLRRIEEYIVNTDWPA